jgi:hypothetical protein
MVAGSGILSKEYAEKYGEYLEIIKDLITIAEKEASDKKLTKEENEYLYDLPYVMSSIIIPKNGNILDKKDLQMALIADVHTDSVSNSALEVATGIPYRMYVALNDGIGGKRIAVGYVFSFYEFIVPSPERMTDDSWKEKVYGKDSTFVDDKVPSWVDFVIKK